MTSFQNPSQDVIAACLKNAKTIAEAQAKIKAL